ncbi:MAG: low-specificity L-threonine aldolase [Desulforhopalus sp.]|nr:low-specificity L-threonine aldolase [Desulforhopalus sp.]
MSSQDKIIDLRSDTVTKPSEAMRRVMADAPVGDDVYGDDPTVNRLEAMTAELLGFEAAAFATSGTQANLIGIISHCQRGDEYIVGQTAHTYEHEAGGAAVFGSVQPQPIEFETDSTLDLNKVAAKIKPDDFHFARTRLFCLENTHNGQALPRPYLTDAGNFARAHSLKFHLDGARLMNAAVAQGVDAAELTRPFDSSTICLSKGLGAPVGSLLCGDREFIHEAKKWRKMAGGGMRQAGILAAAGIYALENNIDRLAEDHALAENLAGQLKKFAAKDFQVARAQTNMVFVQMDGQRSLELADFLGERGVLVNPGVEFRLVTHLDVTAADINYFVQLLEAFFCADSKGYGSLE